MFLLSCCSIPETIWNDRRAWIEVFFVRKYPTVLCGGWENYSMSTQEGSTVNPVPPSGGRSEQDKRPVNGFFFLYLYSTSSAWQVITEGLAIWCKGACSACLCSRALMIWILVFTMPTCGCWAVSFCQLISEAWLPLKVFIPYVCKSGSFPSSEDRSEDKTYKTSVQPARL